MNLIKENCNLPVENLLQKDITIVDTNIEMYCTGNESLEYLYDIIYPSGSNGIKLCRTEGLEKSLRVELYILPEAEVEATIKLIVQEGEYLGKCIQQRYGFYDKYLHAGNTYYIYPLYDSSATPNVICQNSERLIMLSTEGPFDYKLLGRTIREIALRKLEEAGYVCLHASACQLNGKGILIIGDSAAGKTTLALSLCKFAGARYLTNDKILVKKTEDNRLVATPFSSAVRLNYGTLKTIEMEDVFSEWELKIGFPKETTDWKEFNGVHKLNILPGELKKILDIDVLGESPIDLVIFPKINMDLTEYKMEYTYDSEVLKRNICTPYDEQFPEDWLNYRNRSTEWLEENAIELRKRIENAVTVKFEYPVTDFKNLCQVIDQITQDATLMGSK